nr:entericidin [Ensifer sp. LCM 4579]
MSKIVIACLSLALLTLSSCGNTVRGFRKDSVETGHAVDDATKRALKATAR